MVVLEDAVYGVFGLYCVILTGGFNFFSIPLNIEGLDEILEKTSHCE